jgi:hypothetical protein
MRGCIRVLGVVGLALAQTACGLSVPQIPEIWDLVADSDATLHMEKQVKKAIFCELRDAIILAHRTIEVRNYYHGQLVSTVEDQPVPDTWGVQLTLTFTVDEASKLNPGATYIWPFKKPATSESFSVGIGGQLSSTATRTDKYGTFYTVGELGNVLSKNEICEVPPNLGPPSHSSPFVVLSDLGIKEWLPAAVQVSSFLRSSRKNPSGEGPPLGSAGTMAADSFTYDVKFVIVSDANATPIWKLVRVTTPSSPALIDTNRTRTHELIITIAPPAMEKVQTAKGLVMRTVPSPSAASSHLAQEIGSAVATALRPALSPPIVTTGP